MSTDWADVIAERLSGGGFPRRGACLILGGVDTGKTTLAAALAGRLAATGPVAVIDADVGQSHIGPPATVGWAIVDNPQIDFTQRAPGGISFVGDVAPPGHLLQLTAAITQCIRQVSHVAERIIIDTPGFIAGPAACALWWAVQRIVRPELILAVQRENELSNVVAGMKNLGSQIERLECPLRMPAKSPQARRRYRRSRFASYFANSRLYSLKRADLTIQATHSPYSGRLVGLRDPEGIDRAVGIIESWQQNNNTAIVRAPQLDIGQIRCLVVGEVTVDLASE